MTPRMPDDNEISTMLAESRATAFAPGFADRVMRRVSAERRAALVLPRQAARVLPAVLAASLVLAAVNVFRAGESTASPLVRALGLPNVSVASALTLDAEVQP